MRTSARLALIAALCAFNFRPVNSQQKCSSWTIDQQNYVGLNDRVYVYVPNIDKSGGGWKPFAVRVLVGQYRRPLLLTKGFMKEKDLVALLSTRQDVSRIQVPVPGFSPKSGAKPAPGTPVPFKVEKALPTIRVVTVDPAAGVSARSDRVTVEVCGL